MAISLTVRNVVYQYPNNGEPRGWGEDATAWAEAVTTLLSDLLGDDDIPPSSASINNSQATFAPVTGLVFSTSTVRAAIIEYAVTRGSDVESGEMRIVFNGTSWDIAIEYVGNAGMQFSIDSSGQIQYRSTVAVAGTMKFRARTLAQ